MIFACDLLARVEIETVDIYFLLPALCGGGPLILSHLLNSQNVFKLFVNRPNLTTFSTSTTT